MSFLLQSLWFKMCFLLCFLASGFDANAQQKSTLKVKVPNLQSHKGVLFAALYIDENSFLDPNQSFASKRIEHQDGDTISFHFENLAPGTYALAIFLDKNQNKKLDTNILGIPKEPFGFSVKKVPRFRAPTFEEAAFSVNGDDHEVTIKLIFL